MTSTFRVQISEIGEVDAITEVFDDENTRVAGLPVLGEALAREILTNHGAYRETNYYDWATEEFLDRPAAVATISKTELLADETDSILISGIPLASGVFPAGQLFIDGVEYPVEVDGTQEFGTDLVGTYIIEVVAFPYITQKWEVTAT